MSLERGPSANHSESGKELSRREFLESLAVQTATIGIGATAGAEGVRYGRELGQNEVVEEQIPGIVGILNSAVNGVKKVEGLTLKQDIVFSPTDVEILFSADGVPHVVVSYEGEAFFEDTLVAQDLDKNLVDALVDFLYKNDFVEVL